jgi:hypothetical protein
MSDVTRILTAIEWGVGRCPSRQRVVAPGTYWRFDGVCIMYDIAIDEWLEPVWNASVP